ncbi:MAG: hypothetical protein EHM93_01620 [Bacteroidales bacterium]|nr:MAG: hypothetical protein EHM93_01620 [Bacteroidales bacterium]
MKNLLLFLFAIGIITSTYAQDPETKLKALESKDSTLSMQNDTLKKHNLTKSDSTKIRIGRKSITIFDDDENTFVRFPNRKYNSKWDIEYRQKRSFRGHWAGVEFGINGYMDKNQSLTMKDDVWYLDLKQARSWNFNVNFMQYSIGFGTNKIGLVTGMGLEFNNYHFSNPISLKVDRDNGMTVVDSTYIKGSFKVNKTKLATTHLTIPLLLEFQIPTGDHGHRIFISGGVIGELRIGAHTKVVYDDNGKNKDKNREDFNLSTFRYSYTVRIGYQGLKLFANYSPVQLFENNKGPEVYPFSVGLILFNFN